MNSPVKYVAFTYKLYDSEGNTYTFHDAESFYAKWRELEKKGFVCTYESERYLEY